MSEEEFTERSLSFHLRFGAREGLVAALQRMGVARAEMPVWPPRPLPPGLIVSPERGGWISLWPMDPEDGDWLPELSATLECPAIAFEVVEQRFWTAELYVDGEPVGRIEMPTEAVEADALWAMTADSLEEEGHDRPWEDEARFERRRSEIAESTEYRRRLEASREERPDERTLEPFVPLHSTPARACDLLASLDTPVGEDGLERDPVDAMETFAAYLGIPEAGWDPQSDADSLSAGEYDEEDGLPEGWREFVLLPSLRLRVL